MVQIRINVRHQSKSKSLIYIFLQKTNFSRGNWILIIDIYFTQIHYLTDESRTVFNEMVQDQHINRTQ